MTVTEAFPDQGLSRLNQFSIKIEEGLITPLSVRSSESFRVVITDAEDHEINYVNTALTLTMKQGKDVGPNFVEVGDE